MENQIYKALTGIIGEVNAIGKNSKNQQQGFMFRGIDDVMNELHTLFGKYKVVIVPEVVDYNVSEKTTAKGTIMYVTRSTIKFHFVAEDGSEVVTTNVGEAMDSADKGMNKTMSCALKYALMQMFLIPTKETEDADRVTPPDTVPTKTMNIDRDMAFDDVRNAKSSQGVADVWHQHQWLHKDAEFVALVKEVGGKLKAENK
jgi:hypothetical protein